MEKFPKAGFLTVKFRDMRRVELEPLFQEALRRPTPFIATVDGGTDDARIPPSIEKLGVQSLLVAPLRTLRHRLGMVLAGRENLERFSREEELVLSTLAEHSAIGLENRPYMTSVLEKKRHW
ncbi:MAG: GAF domain-containing protein [Deltaproteobacteria bacterium]|nr:GAF domain-containing protein [Deltaproteobacteria bacterium]